MTQENKDLLVKEITARLPYKLKAYCIQNDFDVEITGLFGVDSADITCTYVSIEDYIDSDDDIKYICPYLRPMSSMTDEEKETIEKLSNRWIENNGIVIWPNEGDNVLEYKTIMLIINWLNAHHFDYMGLIEKGLANEAPEDMYKFK